MDPEVLVEQRDSGGEGGGVRYGEGGEDALDGESVDWD